ncbi:hypothetical protein Y032_0769g2201 [Ancylostoma ceylanicum]|uniref:Uncharacterized protein n=1 Tax=Ancylostoma ceylanicum TaxID=53326 RepID=A0A016WEK8_9BILA|nr:hypothetical protein Y032_0769g2201 [Ancylostoma ceylanicum]
MDRALKLGMENSSHIAVTSTFWGAPSPNSLFTQNFGSSCWLEKCSRIKERKTTSLTRSTLETSNISTQWAFDDFQRPKGNA